MYTSRQIFTSLRGDWHLDRSIEDFLLKEDYKATGRAAFVPSLLDPQNEYEYSEQGTLVLNETKHLHFNRLFTYRWSDDSILVYFNDGLSKGKLYQKLELSAQSGTFEGSEHLCIQDLYTGSYRFIDDNQFEITYRVKGPAKDLNIVTQYMRDFA